MRPDDGAIFLSIKPQHAQEILAGRKTVELRRVRPLNLQRGSLVVLYASGPIHAVLGTFTVRDVVTCAPDDLWEQVTTEGRISRSEFDIYFRGSVEAVGIFIDAPKRISAPYRLDEIRGEWPGFHPPQAFRYLQTMGEWAVSLLARLKNDKLTEQVNCPS